MDKLLSVGLDIGTTTSQLIVSELTVQNQASAFAVPEMTIADRNILYQSPVMFTPLLDESHVDGAKLGQMIRKEYEKAGISRESVDTGAIIITGETSRKENARAVLEGLEDLAGDFVVATAGPDLESVLAAKGSGAVELSAETGKTVLHMDIGGGTSNLALIEEGRIVATGCLNVGGRLVKFDEGGRVIYVSPVLEGLTDLRVGQRPENVDALAELLASALEMAAGLREPTDLMERLWTKETNNRVIADRCAHRSSNSRRLPRHFAPRNDSKMVISFSGGVADCIGKDLPERAFGDMGPALGRAIFKSRLCQGEYVLGRHTIRATVIGAGCHSAQLSGSTVFHRNMGFPAKNLPIVTISEEEQASEDLPALLRSRLAGHDGPAVAALPGFAAAGYRQIAALAEKLLAGFGTGPVYAVTEQDMAKALGQAIALRTEPERRVLCLDRLRLEEGSYLDVAAPVGPALPVVIKTLILQR